MQRVAVIGGGIAGLAAAYRLKRNGVAVTLYEAGDRLGGVIRSEQRAGYLMEAGPDSFLDKLGIRELCAELGLSEQLISVQPGVGRSLIARGSRLLPIPEGLQLMAPSAIRPFLRSNVVSPAGKLRMLLDLVIPARAGANDESLATFVRRRLGREALERLAQPMIGGIYSADPERLSLRATMPRFLEMEARQGSVIRALLASGQRSAGARYNLFLSLRGGLESLVRALADRLDDVRLNSPVRSLPEGDGVCLCVAPSAGQELAPNLEWPVIPYSSMATVNLGFRRKDVHHPLNGAGFVVPAVEARSIVACTFSSQKFEGRAPDERVLLRVFSGGMLAPERCAADDDHLVHDALVDLDQLLGLNAEPEMVWINRLPASMPQYEVGHVAATRRLFETLPSNLSLAGNGYSGVGLPDCIAGGFAAADRLTCAA